MNRLFHIAIWLAMPLWVIACIMLASAAHASNYGCRNLDQIREMPVLEGKSGVFFRIQSDLRMDHRVSDEAIELLARLRRALEARGTLLVYVPVPTKGLAMPHVLPREAKLYGYDAMIGTRVFDDLVKRMKAAGVLAVNPLQHMQKLPSDKAPFFHADFHWTPSGAHAAALAVGETLSGHPAVRNQAKIRFQTRETGMKTAFSGQRRIMQKYCAKALPLPRAMGFETRKDQPVETLDLFGEQDVQAVLVGTSFSDSDISNFAGFLSQELGLEVQNHALTGGNQFGAITDYLISDEFNENPPKLLIWENPIYNSLTRFSAQPMDELIAAAQRHCPTALHVQDDEDGAFVSLFDEIEAGDSLSVRIQPPGQRRLVVRFTNAAGETITKTLTRSERQAASTRFFMPLSGLGKGRWDKVTFLGAKPVEVALCSDQKGEI